MDERILRALGQLLHSRNYLARSTYLVGGVAMWDWWHGVTQAGDGVGGLEEPRPTTDMDLGIAHCSSPHIHMHAIDTASWRGALHDNGWGHASDVSPGHTYINANHMGISLEFVTFVDGSTHGGQIVTIRQPGEAKTWKAVAALPLMLQSPAFVEPCIEQRLRAMRLNRLSHVGLLVSKIFAVWTTTQELLQHVGGESKPPAWTERLEKDVSDVRLLLDQQVRDTLEDYRSTSTLHMHRVDIADWIAGIRRSVPIITPCIPPHIRVDIREVALGLDQWWTIQ